MKKIFLAIVGAMFAGALLFYSGMFAGPGYVRLFGKPETVVQPAPPPAPQPSVVSSAPERPAQQTAPAEKTLLDAIAGAREELSKQVATVNGQLDGKLKGLAEKLAALEKAQAELKKQPATASTGQPQSVPQPPVAAPAPAPATPAAPPAQQAEDALWKGYTPETRLSQAFGAYRRKCGRELPEPLDEKVRSLIVSAPSQDAMEAALSCKKVASSTEDFSVEEEKELNNLLDRYVRRAQP